MPKRKPKRKTKRKKCIYFNFCGNMAERRSQEHAYPKNLMPENACGVTINGIVCMECNQRLGNVLDEPLLKQSYVGLTHNDFEVCAGLGDRSIYHQRRHGKPPMREFGEFNHSILILDPKHFVNDPNVLAHRFASPMPSQLILTRQNKTTSYEDILGIVRQNPAYDDICEDDVYRLHSNYLVFGPDATKRYYRNPAKFVEKFLKETTDDSEIFQLLLVPPDPKDFELCCEEQHFKEFVKSAKTVLGEYYTLPETIESYSGRAVGATDYRRGIAKIAFHCLLHLYQKEREKKTTEEKHLLTGNEPIFNEIKAYIYNGDYRGRIPVVEAPPNDNYTPIGDRCVVRSGSDGDFMVEHIFNFFMNDKNIVCVIEFYVASKENCIFTIDLAGHDEFVKRTQHGNLTIPYCVVSSDHPLLRRLIPPSSEEIAMANRGDYQHLLQPTRILSPTAREVAKVTCGFHKR